MRERERESDMREREVESKDRENKDRRTRKVWFSWFYGISTFGGHLTSNPFLCK